MRLGVRDFLAWIAQAEREIKAERADDPHSWKGADRDRRWQEMREARDKARGYQLKPVPD
jgi:hypothetical protein